MPLKELSTFLYCLVEREEAEGRERCLWLRCCPGAMGPC